MPSPPDSGGFRQLWPTLFLERTLPGHEAANQVLAELIEQQDRKRAQMTTDYLAGNFFAQEHPAIQWLKGCIDKTAIDTLKHMGLDYAVNWTVQGWANVNRLGDYHDAHNHPRSYLSGTYYVRMPEGPAEIGSRDDLRSGAITFYDPRGQVNMTAIKQDPNIEAEFTLKPKAGTILMWPSFLHHFVHPNLTKQPRITISYNIVLKWSDDYLPGQR